MVTIGIEKNKNNRFPTTTIQTRFIILPSKVSFPKIPSSLFPIKFLFQAGPAGRFFPFSYDNCAGCVPSLAQRCAGHTLLPFTSPPLARTRPPLLYLFATTAVQAHIDCRFTAAAKILFLQFSARGCNTFHELFLEDQVDDDHRNDCQHSGCHHCRIVAAVLSLHLGKTGT